MVAAGRGSIPSGEVAAAAVASGVVEGPEIPVPGNVVVAGVDDGRATSNGPAARGLSSLSWSCVLPRLACAISLVSNSSLWYHLELSFGV